MISVISFGSVLEAADRLGCNENHVYYLINIGELFAVKVRWIYRLDLDMVEAYATRRTAQEAGERSSRPSQHPGYLFDPAGFIIDRSSRALASRWNHGFHGGRRMDGRPDGLSGLSLQKRNTVIRPLQYELAIS